MLIAAVESYLLRIPFVSGSSPAPSAWAPTGRHSVDSLLVKVTTDDGLEGWGEGFGHMAAPVVGSVVDAMIAPLCIGKDPRRIVPLMDELQRRLAVFGRGGPVAYGLSAIDIALWDIAGKAAGFPVQRILGGGRDELPCYASLDACGDPELVRAAVEKATAAGFDEVKLHECELPAIRAGVEAAGPGVRVMVDVNAPWTTLQAREVAAQLRDERLMWLEEPVWPPEHFAGLLRVRREGNVPVAAGENVSTMLEFHRLLESEAVDFVQPSPAKMGGVTELGAVFRVAGVHGVTVMPHSFYTGPGLLAAIHTTAAFGGGESLIEWQYFELEAQIYGDALVPVRGRIAVPSGPGLGIDPDPDVLRFYRTTW